MIDRGRFTQERGGRRRGSRSRDGRGRGGNSSALTKHMIGLYVVLGENTFNYNETGPAGQKATTLKQVVTHIQTIYGQDISNRLQNHALVTIIKLIHDKKLLDKHAIQKVQHRTISESIQGAWRANKKCIIEVEATERDFRIERTEL